MKRSFYEMLGIPHNADQSQIDDAYASTTARLNATTNVRGIAESVTEVNLLREGYQILSNPAQRAKYDAKLAAAEAGIQLMFMPEDSTAFRKLAIQTLIFAVLVAVFGSIVYSQLTRKMDEVNVDYQQVVAKKKEAQNKAVTIDATLQSKVPDTKTGE